MAEVISASGVPGTTVFQSRDGTPLYINLATGIAYFLNAAGAVTPIVGGGAGTGTVTHTVGALTVNRLVVGNAADDIDVLASLGTITTVLHGNAAGRPTFGAVNLATDVTGVLPVANGGSGSLTGFSIARTFMMMGA